MKVFNLCCEHEHGFEGWFARAEDFDVQLDSGLLECPSCGSREIRKMLSAPRLNLGRGQPEADAATPPEMPKVGPAQLEHMHALWLQAARHLIENTEDVGDRFPEEARRIHYKESAERAIRGSASLEQAAELAQEGIEVLAFPLPDALKTPIQ